MKHTRVALIWTLLALVTGNVRAEVVADLHSATVPVANQSSEALTAAAREALADVLVKVSGSSELLQKPLIVTALDDARSRVQQYAYERGVPPAAGLFLNVVFDGPYVTNLVKRAGAPLWTANRPTVLIWAVVEDEQGKHFVNKDTAPLEAQMLLQAFSRRGVPAQLPAFDPVDTAALSAEDAWSLDATVIQAASARYKLGDVVAGRLATLSSGEALGDWSYLYQGEHSDRSVTVPDQQTFFREGVNLVAGELAARYAVSPTGSGKRGVRIAVSGVSSYADYAAIVKSLEGLELVDHANIEQVQGDRIELRLQAQADAAQLAPTIELNSRFVPIPVTESQPQGAPGSAPESANEPGSAPANASANEPGSAPASASASANEPGFAPAPEIQPSAQLNYQWRR